MKGRIRDDLRIKPRSLEVLRKAMLRDVEDQVDGGGKLAAVPGLRICAKTGTAQNERDGKIDLSNHTTWFLSFAPYENPRYAVVVMCENGGSGGQTCAPIAHDIYQAIQQQEKKNATKPDTLAQTR